MPRSGADDPRVRGVCPRASWLAEATRGTPELLPSLAPLPSGEHEPADCMSWLVLWCRGRPPRGAGAPSVSIGPASMKATVQLALPGQLAPSQLALQTAGPPLVPSRLLPHRQQPCRRAKHQQDMSGSTSQEEPFHLHCATG